MFKELQRRNLVFDKATENNLPSKASKVEEFENIPIVKTDEEQATRRWIQPKFIPRQH